MPTRIDSLSHPQRSEYSMCRHRTMPLLAICGSLILLLLRLYPGHGLVTPARAAQETAGYSDFSYADSGVSTTPTGEKPQSKLWYNDGRWWGDLFNPTTHTYHIYWLDLANQTWLDTGTELDSRPATKADCLWDGTHLYVASGGGSATGANLDGLLFRYSYNASTKTYTPDTGFPVTIRSGGAETLVIDKDTTGKLWITYTQSNKVWVNHSTTADTQWDQPFNPPMPPALAASINVDPDDISSLIAFDGKIGVLWSNQTDATFYFAYHVDGAPDTSWTGGIAARVTDTPLADDHINLKSLRADPSGQLFAVVKTSINGTSSSTPQILVLVRKLDGSWSSAMFSSGAENQTRPILLIDIDHRQMYVFASDEGGGSVYYKQSGLDNVQFAPGRGTPFISSSTYTLINDATSTKQNVNSASGIVVLASDDNHKWYLHNYLDLGGQFPRLVFSTEPGDAQVAAPLAPQPVVTAQDEPGHTANNFNGPVTLTIKSGTGTPGARLTGTLTVNAVNGVARFSGIAIDTAGTGYQLMASTSGMSSGDSSRFDIAKADQTISFAPLPNKTYGDPPFSVSATASSGLSVSFSAAGNCTIAGNTVTLSGAGSCTVTAHQPGNANYNPAPDVARTFDIAKADQTISFAPLPNRVVTDPPFAVTATASSGLPVSFSAAGNCTIVGNTVTLSGAGSCTVTAHQPGNANYNPAPDVARTFVIIDSFKAYLPLVQEGAG